MVPGIIMLLLALIPAMMTAVGVVREKEMGSIANFRSTPVTRLEFLLGKQGPYVAIALLSFLALLAMARFIFGVPVKGSMGTLFAGALLYLGAATGFGLLVSSFTRTQVAATFATAILTVTPAVNFSGFFVPVSSLSGAARVVGLLFPAAWFQPISVGVFAKGLGLADLWPDMLALAGFGAVFIALAALLLRKQEA
jgi:ribosome-dependent ATPase